MALLSEVILSKKVPNYEEIERGGGLERKRTNIFKAQESLRASLKRTQEAPGERSLVQALDKVK